MTYSVFPRRAGRRWCAVAHAGRVVGGKFESLYVFAEVFDFDSSEDAEAEIWHLIDRASQAGTPGATHGN